MRPLRLAFVGFGNVGRRFVELLPGPYGRALRAAGVRPLITGIATGRHGAAIDAGGISARRALGLVRAGRSLDGLHRSVSLGSALAFVRHVPADVLVELSPLEPQSGQPALSHVRAALRRGLHVVTANKGPVAHAGASLRRLAERQGRLFLHEGTVMDGAPVFNMVERCLQGTQVQGFRGLLNATTTRILTAMERGIGFDAALADAQAAGVTEADPRYDIDGWDAAVKACALANTLLDARIRPADVRRRGIGRLSPLRVSAAARAGRRIRLIARGRGRGRSTSVSVAPEELAADDVLMARGADGVLVIETDLMGEIAIWEGAGGVDQTAYAILSDLLRVASAG